MIWKTVDTAPKDGTSRPTGGPMTIHTRDYRFLGMAQAIAEIWSNDPTSKVGAIAVGERPYQVAWATSDDADVISDAMFPVRTLYVTCHPCDRRAIEILAARTIKRVVYIRREDFEERWKQSCHEARVLLEEGGVVLEGVTL